MKLLNNGFNIALLVSTIFLIDTSGSYHKTSLIEFINPCQSYLTISIGTIDPEFKISREEVERIALEANNEWESEIRKFFPRIKEEHITINFIHTNDTETGKEEYRWDNKIRTIQSSIQIRRLGYISNLQNLHKEWEVFEEEVNSYDQKRIVWQRSMDVKKIEDLNLLREYLLKKESTLELKRMSLEKEYDELKEMRLVRDSLMNEYGQRLNFKEEITLGVYELNGSNKSIDIYYYNNLEQLKSILLHEFGHVYGVKHVESSSSIMRHKIEANGVIKAKLSISDIEAIKAVCSTDS